MGLISKGTGGGTDFEPVPTGTHIARCISVVDLGFQETRNGMKEKVYLGFEVPAIRVSWKKDNVDHEGPALIGATYNNSVHPKSVLGQHLVNWRGRAFTELELEGFDLFTVLNVWCMVSVVHNVKDQRTYANISGIMGLPKGTMVPPAETPVVAYTPQDAAYAMNLSKLPEWLQRKCADGGGQHGAPPDHHNTPPPIDDFDDDIPF